MIKNRRTNTGSTQLPAGAIDHLTKPFWRFLRIEAAGGAMLLVSAIAGLIISNSPLGALFSELWTTRIGIQLGSFDYARSLRAWVDQGLMTFFFFLVALELKRELVLGELKNARLAGLSIASATGGMLVPAALYLALQMGRPGASGWGTVMATDTAFVVGCLALLGNRIPQSLRVFMLALAIVDDIGAILVVAIGYSHHIAWEAIGLSIVGFIIVRAMSMAGIRSFAIYFVVGGGIWLAVDASGIHATTTGVILGLMTPARRWVNDERLYAILRQVVAYPTGDYGSGDTRDRKTLQMAEIAAREALSPAERLEIGLHPWVSFIIMPLFAFSNADLPLSFDGLDMSVTLAIFAGFVLGKPAGILLFSWLAVRTRIAVLPADLTWRLVIGGSVLAGIGFTMALLIAKLGFSDDLLSSAKLGIFSASIVSAGAGMALLLWLPLRGPERIGNRGIRQCMDAEQEKQ